MSTLQPATPAKLFLSLLYSGGPEPAVTALAGEALAALEAIFGPADLCSPPLSFRFTDYYAKEMGTNLWRLAASFDQLIAPERLVEIKHFTVSVEQRLADPQGRRRVNLDPGLLTVDNLILATGKKSPHRIYLGRGVYADLTLLYRNGGYAALPWTYPDYAGEELQGWLRRMRARLLEQLRAQKD